MTDHKPMPVAGYTPQPQTNIDLANEGKELEERYLRWLDKQESDEWARSPSGQAIDYLMGIDERLDDMRLTLAKALTALDNGDWSTYKEILENAFQIERRNEREACAKIADETSAWCRSLGAEETAERIAAAIRARGEQT